MSHQPTLTTNKVSKFGTDYLFGHPLIAKPQMVYLAQSGDDISIIERYTFHNNPPFVQLATIPLASITSIIVEGEETVEKLFSLGKYMLIGAYAFAYPKKDKVETAYLVIRWQLHHVESVAVFSNKGEDAIKNIQQAQLVFLHWMELAKQKEKLP